MAPAAEEMSGRDGKSPLRHALEDGEDYELLLAAEPAAVDELRAEWQRKFPLLPLTVIGRIIPSPDAAMERRLLDARGGRLLLETPGGYTHF